MKLDPFDLLAPGPIPIPGAGAVCSPTLREIKKAGIQAYHSYLGLFSINLDSYLEAAGASEAYESLPDRERPSLFELLLAGESTAALLWAGLDFFFCGSVRFDPAQTAFVIEDSNPLFCGTVDKENYPRVRHCILQANYITVPDEAEPVYKNAKARQIAEKLRKAKTAQKKSSAANNLTLANMVSALAVQHNSLNLSNIWDLTVYQLYDQFFRQNNKNQLDIHAMNYAGWGGEFDPTSWFRALDK